ncbi:MAG: tRNA (N(6)-L-threonylcarbamoyladenosine(37)-C(2))-methylthiotransferase MtaB [Bacteroidetes bacterium]|nr:tRNA (N(6)-L-threonylcarbamoyladenosine(37)-C(2))-methylthiotransferase MtaB [Bacteroidota bacterium]
MKRIALHTLGCKLNYAETAAIGKVFASHGYKITGIDEPADVVIINSCTVTSLADRECRQMIRRAVRTSPDAFVAVIGCYSQLQPDKAASIDGVDLVLGTKDKLSIYNRIENEKSKKNKIIDVAGVDDNLFEPASSAGFEDRTRAFLKIQDGCDYRCSYCTIPLARGGSRSASVEQILQQAREAVELGYKEIVLTGVNVGDYKTESGDNILALLRPLARIDGIERIRISSIEPNLLLDELLDFWFETKVLCRHWHIPLQSGSDSILKKMGRRYLTKQFAERVEKIKTAVPSACVGSDVIVGFPGETDVFFNETYDFLSVIPLSYFHIFHYSERENTKAAEFDNKVDPRIKAKRSGLLRQLGVKKRTMFNRVFEGKTVKVLFESEYNNHTQTGLTEEYVRVNVESGLKLSNTIADVKITEVLSDKCIGIIV